MSSPGNFEIEARVDTVQNVQPWTKAGLMARTSLDPSAAQASIFATPGKGIAFQRRRSGGAISINTSGPAVTAPVWLRLTGLNGTLRAHYRKNRTDPWTFLGEDVLNGPAAHVGLAVTSHADGTVATATFSTVRAGTPPGWSGPILIGTTSGSATYDATSYTLNAKGADIWGTADAFAYLHAATSFVAQATIIARVNSVDNTSPWAKAGVMFRESPSAGSKHVVAMVTPGKGVNLQYRPATGGESFSAASVAGVAPGWLRLKRSGNTFTASWSTDGVAFVDFGTITVAMENEIRVGLAMTSHNASAAGVGRFDDVQIIQP